MNYSEFAEYVKGKSISNIYLFEGDEDFLRDHCAGVIKKRALTDEFFDVHRIEGKNCIDSLSEAVENMPLFSVNKFIEVSGSGLLSAGKTNQDTALAARLLASLDNNIYIVFLEKEKLKKPENNPLYKLIKEHGIIVDCSIQNDEELKKGIMKKIFREKYKISPENAKLFVELSDRQMNTLNNEIDKIMAYKGDDKIITSKDIKELTTRSINIKIFSLLDALSQRKRDDAMVMLDEMLQLKEPEQKILFLITKNFIDMLKITQLKKKGASNGEIMKKMNEKFEFVIRKHIGFSRKFTEKEMVRIIKCCVRADSNIKEGIFAPRLSLEILIAEISA